MSRRAAKDRQISRVTLYTSLQTSELHLGALILSLNEDYLGRDTQTQRVMRDSGSHLTTNALLPNDVSHLQQRRFSVSTPAAFSNHCFTCVCLHLSLGASVL